MMYTVRAFLLQAGGKAAKDLGKIDIEVNGPLARDAVAKFLYLDRTEVGSIDHLERYGEPDRVPTVYIVQSRGA